MSTDSEKPRGPSKTFLVLLGLVVVFFLYSSRSTYDYTLNCSKCLAQKHVVEHQLLGLPITHRTSLLRPGEDYEALFGHPCDHVFHKGGFGRQTGVGIGCGITGEGIFIRPRMDAVAATFDLATRFGDKALALETFQFIDSMMPPDARMEERRSPLYPVKTGSLYMLKYSLEKAESIGEWRTALDTTRAEAEKSQAAN